MQAFSKLKEFIEKTLIGKLSDYGFPKHKLAASYFAVLNVFNLLLNPWMYLKAAQAAFYYLPFIAPFVLLHKIRTYWKVYIRSDFLSKQEYTLLEVILPHDFEQSPAAMEAFLGSLYINQGESTVIATKWKGSTRPWWSLELVSIEGELHIYIWTWKKFRQFLENNFYAQFPNCELVEVQDYMDGLFYDYDKIALWGTDYKFVKPDVYPIKSYIDWKLDKIDHIKNKDEIVDPINSVYEKLAAIGEGEVVILQIMFQQTLNNNWQKEVEDEIENIYESRTQEYTDMANPEETVKGFAQLRPQDYDLVNTLKHSISKDAFDVGIRSLYIAKKDKFKPGERVGPNHVNLFIAFEAPNLNFPKGLAHWLAGFDYPWEDIWERERIKRRKKILDAARRRAYFHTPYSFDPLILTTEELATIFHFPVNRTILSKLAAVQRSKKIAPPQNLPS